VSPGPDGGPRSSAPLIVFAVATVAAAALALFDSTRTEDGLLALASFARVPYAFVLFTLVLLGVALFHRQALQVALAGVLVLTVYTFAFRPAFDLPHHFVEESGSTLLNLLGLLVGFALLAKHFEHSGVPQSLPRLLPRGPFAGAFALLAMVWILSSFLDNIAGAMIGGVIARVVYRGRVTVAFVAAIVAASNAGGAGSVVGDTTTTMMWIAKVPAADVARAFLASGVALVVLGVFGSLAQNRFQRMQLVSGAETPPIDKVRLLIVGCVLLGAIATNILWEQPFLGVWAALLLGGLARRPDWSEVPGAARGALFLLSLVWCASLMPVQELPPASVATTFGLGLVSAVFDNIPLTKLALLQGGYDWGLLAFAVGFGGSLLWFGSSAGVAISKDFPEARSVGRYVKEGWFILPAYVLGFLVMWWVLGWHPVTPG
jgi:Na+/H+ antiporter NhaD/arsenite permease-like protein